MKKEQIEEAARFFSNIWAGNPSSVDDILVKDYYEFAFERGAEWRVESIWHDIDKEMPEDGKLILASGECGAFVCGPNNAGFNETASVLKLKQWAYVDDLLPNVEE